MILGNNLAGGRVWCDVTSPPVVRNVPSVSELGNCALDFPDAFLSCTVTCAMTCSLSNEDAVVAGRK